MKEKDKTRKEIQKEIKKSEKGSRKHSAQPKKRPEAQHHPVPNWYTASPLSPLTCGTHMSGSPPTSRRSPLHARDQLEPPDPDTALKP
jgi:hypothetical protein